MGDRRFSSKILGAGVAGAAALAAYVCVIRRWHLRWGATKSEAQMPLPGDDQVPHPKLSATHAITIHAPAADVWSWLVQMGQGRGGFYSYDWLENLVGLNIQSANQIVPEFQNLKVGEIVPVAPGGFGPQITVLEPGRALVLHGREERKRGAYFDSSWAFFLKPLDERATRLIIRFRLDYNPTLLNALGYHALLEPAHFIMERKMLLGIKQRTEALAAERHKVPVLGQAP